MIVGCGIRDRAIIYICVCESYRLHIKLIGLCQTTHSIHLLTCRKEAGVRQEKKMQKNLRQPTLKGSSWKKINARRASKQTCSSGNGIIPVAAA